MCPFDGKFNFVYVNGEMMVKLIKLFNKPTWEMDAIIQVVGALGVRY